MTDRGKGKGELGTKQNEGHFEIEELSPDQRERWYEVGGYGEWLYEQGQITLEQMQTGVEDLRREIAQE